MRIQGESHHSGYPLASAAVRTVAPRRDADAPRQNSRASLAVYVAQQAPDAVEGVSPHAQRAIAAYTQNDMFEHRTQYAQLLGVDVYV